MDLWIVISAIQVVPHQIKNETLDIYCKIMQTVLLFIKMLLALIRKPSAILQVRVFLRPHFLVPRGAFTLGYPKR